LKMQGKFEHYIWIFIATHSFHRSAKKDNRHSDRDSEWRFDRESK